MAGVVKSQRNRKILLRVTEREKEQITADAARVGMSVNDFLCVRALGLPPDDVLNLRAEVQRLAQRVSKLEGRKVPDASRR